MKWLELFGKYNKLSGYNVFEKESTNVRKHLNL